MRACPCQAPVPCRKLVTSTLRIPVIEPRCPEGLSFFNCANQFPTSELAKKKEVIDFRPLGWWRLYGPPEMREAGQEGRQPDETGSTVHSPPLRRGNGVQPKGQLEPRAALAFVVYMGLGWRPHSQQHGEVIQGLRMCFAAPASSTAPSTPIALAPRGLQAVWTAHRLPLLTGFISPSKILKS